MFECENWSLNICTNKLSLGSSTELKFLIDNSIKFKGIFENWLLNINNIQN